MNRSQLNRGARNGVAAQFMRYTDALSSGDESADKYLNECVTTLKSDEDFCISKLQLVDYKRFKHVSINFHRQLTVIVGENGAGKSTILQSIAKALSWIVANIEKEGKPGKRIVYSDINVDSSQYAEINADFLITKNDRFNFALNLAVKGATQKKDSFLTEIKALAEVYRVVNSKLHINLPMFAFYTVDRARSQLTRGAVDAINLGLNSKLNAYERCLDGIHCFEQFQKEFINLDSRANSVEQRVSIEKIAAYQALEKEFLLSQLNGVPNEAIAAQLDELKIDIFKITPPDPLAKRNFELLKTTLISSIENATDFFVDRSSGQTELKVKLENTQLNVESLSDGQKSVIGMIGDIALRLISLNPYKEDPLSGYGVVIVDEIELHLHPRWQQTILPKLAEIFPKLQFIVTTHSPQVLTSVAPECIRGLIAENGEIKLIDNFQFSSGAESQVLLNSILGVSPRPKGLPIVKELERYQELIMQDKWDSKEALDIRQILDKWSRGHETALIEADMDIRMRAFRRSK